MPSLKHLLCNILFWFLLGVDVFAACYWLASRIAALLIGLKWLPSHSGVVFAVFLGALMTPGALIGLISWRRRRK